MYLCALFVMIFTTSCWGDSVKQIQTTSNLGLQLPTRTDRASEGVAAVSQIESRDPAINVTGGSIYKVPFSTRVVGGVSCCFKLFHDPLESYTPGFHFSCRCKHFVKQYFCKILFSIS